MRRPWSLFTLTALALAAPATVHATAVETFPLPGPANGIAVGPDGSAWAALFSSDRLARIAPDGSVTQSAPLGGNPLGVGVVGGKIWATLFSAKAIAIVDPAAPSAAPRSVATPAGRCGPVAVATIGDQAYVSLPADSGVGCFAASAIGKVAASGTGAVITVAGLGTAYDLAVVGGNLFIPDFDGDAVRRTDSGLGSVATFPAPSGSQPHSLAADGAGNVVVSFFGNGGLGRVAAAASSGKPVDPVASVPLYPAAGSMKLPAGVGVASTGQIYVAAKESSALGRLTGSAFTTLPLAAGSQPWRIAAGSDGQVWVTDLANPVVYRVTSRPPRATTGGAAVSAGTATLSGTADAGGNDTAVRFEYGTTTSYGSSLSAPTATGTAPSPVTATANGLASSTTFHYRIVATSSEGTATGEDRTFTTPAVPATSSGPTPRPRPRLAAVPSFKTKVKASRTRIERLRVTGLRGGETIAVTCAGKGCLKSTTVSVKRAGSTTVALDRTALRKGAALTVTISLRGFDGVRSVLTARGKKRPTVVTAAVAGG